MPLLLSPPLERLHGRRQPRGRGGAPAPRRARRQPGRGRRSGAGGRSRRARPRHRRADGGPLMGGIPDVPPVRGGPLDEFWVAAEEGKLRLPRCPICREWSWYPPPTCGTDGVPPVWEEVPLTGTIFSFTVVHRSFLPPGTVEVPYTVALVELDGVPGPRLVGDVRTPEDRKSTRL